MSDPVLAESLLGRILDSSRSDPMTPETAKYLSSVRFSEDDVQRMNALAAKARAGTLTSTETSELSEYTQVGNLLSILKSKARRIHGN